MHAHLPTSPSSPHTHALTLYIRLCRPRASCRCRCRCRCRCWCQCRALCLCSSVSLYSLGILPWDRHLKFQPRVRRPFWVPDAASTKLVIACLQFATLLRQPHLLQKHSHPHPMIEAFERLASLCRIPAVISCLERRGGKKKHTKNIEIRQTCRSSLLSSMSSVTPPPRLTKSDTIAGTLPTCCGL